MFSGPCSIDPRGILTCGWKSRGEPTRGAERKKLPESQRPTKRGRGDGGVPEPGVDRGGQLLEVK